MTPIYPITNQTILQTTTSTTSLTPGPTAVSCPLYDGTTYVSNNLQQFTIECNVDRLVPTQIYAVFFETPTHACEPTEDFLLTKHFFFNYYSKGADWVDKTATSFYAAIEQCSTTTNCVDLSWTYTTGANALKNYTASKSTNVLIWGALLKQSNETDAWPME